MLWRVALQHKAEKENLKKLAQLNCFKKCYRLLFYDFLVRIYKRLKLNNCFEVSTILPKKTIFCNASTVTQERNMNTRNLLFELYLFAISISVFKIVKVPFDAVTSAVDFSDSWSMGFVCSLIVIEFEKKNIH